MDKNDTLLQAEGSGNIGNDEASLSILAGNVAEEESGTGLDHNSPAPMARPQNFDKLSQKISRQNNEDSIKAASNDALCAIQKLFSLTYPEIEAGLTLDIHHDVDLTMRIDVGVEYAPIYPNTMPDIPKQKTLESPIQTGQLPATQERVDPEYSLLVEKIKLDVVSKIASLLEGDDKMLGHFEGMSYYEHVDRHSPELQKLIDGKGVIKAKAWLQRALSEQLLKIAIPDYGLAIKKQGVDPVQYFDENLKQYFLLFDLAASSMEATSPTLNNHFIKNKISKKKLLTA